MYSWSWGDRSYIRAIVSPNIAFCTANPCFSEVFPAEIGDVAWCDILNALLHSRMGQKQRNLWNSHLVGMTLLVKQDVTPDSLPISLFRAIAQANGRTVVAEGIESDEIAIALKHLGCTHGQGYALAKPMSANDYVLWVQNWSPTQFQERLNADQYIY